MYRLLSFLIVILMLAGPALAAENADVRKLLDRTVMPQTATDYANLYYHKCMAANKDERLNAYVQTQCACTSSSLPTFMTLKEMDNLMMKTGQIRNGAYTRMITLGYMPCTNDSVRDYIYDTCMDDPKYSKLKRSIHVCSCIGDYASHAASSVGAYQLPGYMGASGYDMTVATDNPFTYIITSENFTRAMISGTQNCIRSKEFGWGD